MKLLLPTAFGFLVILTGCLNQDKQNSHNTDKAALLVVKTLTGSKITLCGNILQPGQLRCSFSKHPEILGELMIQNKDLSTLCADPLLEHLRTTKSSFYEDGPELFGGRNLSYEQWQKIKKTLLENKLKESDVPLNCKGPTCAPWLKALQCEV